MSKQFDGQKFIGKQRAPRVQIEYDVEIYGAQKKIELPFVVGVLADLSGDNKENLAPVDERDFVEIDIDNFDKRMAQVAPKSSFYVEDTLREDGSLIDVDLTFNSMKDFEPGEIAKRIPELATMLKARNELKELVTYMDGKIAAQDLIEQLLKNPDYQGNGAPPAEMPESGTAEPADDNQAPSGE